MYQGDFLIEVEKRLERLSLDQCRGIIARLAQDRHASSRVAFLDMLVVAQTRMDSGISSASGMDGQERNRSRIASLMAEVRHFIKRAEDGEFAEFDEDDEDSEDSWMDEDEWTEEDEDDEDEDDEGEADEDNEDNENDVDDHDENDADDADDGDMDAIHRYGIRAVSSRSVPQGDLDARASDVDLDLLWTARGATVQQEVLLMLQRAQRLALDGCPDAAVDVFDRLMPVLAGDDVNFSFGSALEAELVDVAPLHLHLLVALHEPEEASSAVRRMMDVHAGLVGWQCLSLDAIRGAGRMPTARWNQFQDAFLAYLSQQTDARSGKLFRDVIRMRDGLDALLAHVRTLGATNPEAWLETQMVMEKETVPVERIGVYCLEMLSVHGLPMDANTPECLEPRVASYLLPAAQYLVMHGAEYPAWRMVGLRAQVDIDPSPLHLAAWMREQKQRNNRSAADMAEDMLLRIAPQPGRKEATRTTFESSIPIIRQFLFMLCRRPIDLQQTVKNPLPYGWSEGNGASLQYGWTLTFLLAQRLSDKSLEQIREGYPSIRYFWDALTNALCRTTTLPYLSYRSFDRLGRYEAEPPDVVAWKHEQKQQMEAMLFEAMGLHPVDENVSEVLENWLQKMLHERVAFILKNKHRGAYDRAATACAACATLLSVRHGEASGRMLMESIRKQYVRFYAFTAALKKAAASEA